MEIGMRRRMLIIATCAALFAVFAFTLYVHSGYVGVIEANGSIRVMGHGPHLRPPWDRVTLYPSRAHEIAIKTTANGPQGKCTFDISLDMSVCPDSIASLHRSFHGEFMESLVSPVVAASLIRRGNASGSWDYGECEKMGKKIVGDLNSSLNQYGIFVYGASLRSFEVVMSPDAGRL